MGADDYVAKPFSQRLVVEPRDGADPLTLNALARQLGGERDMRQALEVILA